MILNYHASLIKFCQDQIALASTSGISTDLAFINLDAQANITELPATDLLGLAAFAVDADRGTDVVHVAFGVLMYQDTNMFRHMALVDQIFRRLTNDTPLDLYRSTDSEKIGWMVTLVGTSVLPVTRAETRALQYLQASFAASKPE